MNSLESLKISENQKKLSSWMKEKNTDFYSFLVFDALGKRSSLYHLTGFKGSTGILLIHESKKFYLIVDGRYLEQAEKEIESSVILLEAGKKGILSTLYETLIKEIQENLDKKKKDYTIGISFDEWDYQTFSFIFKKLKKIFSTSIHWKFFFSKNFFFNLDQKEIFYKKSIKDNINKKTFLNFLNKTNNGLDFEDQYKKLEEWMNDRHLDLFFLSKKSDLTYFLNLRSNETPYTMSLDGSALFFKKKENHNRELLIFLNDFNIFWKEKIQNELSKEISCQIFLKEDLKEQIHSFIKKKQSEKKNLKWTLASNSDIQLNDLMTLKKEKSLDIKTFSFPIEKIRSIKTKEEIESLKKAYKKTSQVVIEAINWTKKKIIKAEKLSEKDLQNKIKELFFDYGAKELSFPTIVAFGKNTSMIHYSQASENIFLKKGDLVLIDLGAYFEDGYASDLTRCFVVEEDYEKVNLEYKKIYTYVLKAFIAPMIEIYPEGSAASLIDYQARNLLWKQNYDFPHSLGHGIGLDVHEYPRISINSKDPIYSSMTFTIEPGIYKKSLAGVRLEDGIFTKAIQNTALERTKDFFTLNPLSSTPFEENLIDFTLLNQREKKWIKDYNYKK